MTEPAQDTYPEQPNPERTISAQRIINGCKTVVAKYDQERKESREVEDFNERMMRYLEVVKTSDAEDKTPSANEKYLLHVHRDGYAVDLGILTNEGSSDISIAWNGLAIMRAQDNDAGILTEYQAVPISDGHIEFANMVLDIFESASAGEIQPSGLHSWPQQR